MFKKLLICAGVVASLNASEDLEITLKNNTKQPIVVQSIKDNYSSLLNADIGEGVELNPQDTLNFKVSVVPTLYFMHTNQRTASDEIEFEVANPLKQSDLEKFSISWEQDYTHAALDKLSSYKINQEKVGNTQFNFTLELK